jgi:hypothetical protein
VAVGVIGGVEGQQLGQDLAAYLQDSAAVGEGLGKAELTAGGVVEEEIGGLGLALADGEGKARVSARESLPPLNMTSGGGVLMPFAVVPCWPGRGSSASAVPGAVVMVRKPGAVKSMWLR